MRLVSVFFILVAIGFAESAEATKLTLFRWNPGYRAESVPVLTQTLTEPELEGIRSGRLPENKNVFRGCYLAHIDYGNFRKPASVGTKNSVASANAIDSVEPKSEIRKICISQKSN